MTSPPETVMPVKTEIPTPSAASAADGDDVVYVGGVELTGSTDNPVYATTDASGMS